jgi:AAA15 family ATPase/GTPase
MIKNISVKNFKSFKDTGEISLGKSTVLIGSNNTGKTTLLQAIALWHLATKKILEKNRQKKTKSADSKDERKGIPITRKEIFALPTKDLRNIWHELTVKPKVEIHVTLFFEEEEFDLAIQLKHRGEELIYAQEIVGKNNKLLKKPEIFDRLNIAFLPTMSGLLASESRFLDQEAIDARIGEGLTGSVLRNICYRISNPEVFATSDVKNNSDLIQNKKRNWDSLVKNMKDLFAIELYQPEMAGNGDIEIFYSKDFKKKNPTKLEIANSGRGMQQVLLLLSYLMVKPNSILLLDEPDAHLEVLKQREVYKLLKELSSQNNSQIIAASHSEIVLEEAINHDDVIAFYPNSTQKNIDSNTRKHLVDSLKVIKIEDYYYAEKTRFILYIEGSTDFDILKAFATKLNHKLKEYLNDDKVFRYEFADKPGKQSGTKKHFQAIKETISDGKIYGIILLDSDNKTANDNDSEVENLKQERWGKYEIENYFFSAETLKEFAKREQNKRSQNLDDAPTLFFSEVNYSDAMDEIVKNSFAPKDLKDKKSEYWSTAKASKKIEEILVDFCQKTGLPKGFSSKNNFHELVDCMPENKIDPEIKEKLDLILKQITQ